MEDECGLVFHKNGVMLGFSFYKGTYNAVILLTKRRLDSSRLRVRNKSQAPSKGAAGKTKPDPLNPENLKNSSLSIAMILLVL